MCFDDRKAEQTLLAANGAGKLDEIFQECADLVQDVSFSRIKAWKAENPGAKAIGYFPVYAPVELIHALGMLPVGLNGAGDRLDIQHADARFGSFICSIVKTTLELAMTGHLDFLDGMLFSSICDSARNLCFVCMRNFSDRFYTDFLHLPHNPGSRASIEFLAAEYRRLKASLERVAGRSATDADLARAIGTYNQNRALVRALYELRDREPSLIKTTELYSLLRAGNLMPPDEHRLLLKRVLEELPGREAKRRDNIRVVIEGSFCEQPPLGLIKLLEDAGCYIVDDDFILGARWFNQDVPTEGDPMLSLAEAYIDRSVYSSVRHDWRRPRFVQLVEKVRRRRADGVIFCIAKFCEPAYFDYVLFKEELEKEQIPHLLIEFEEKMFTFERLRTEIETFVESMLFD